MIYDVSDIELLRFIAAAKNIPLDLHHALKLDIWAQDHIKTLCCQELIVENRNHLSYSLTTKGAALLHKLGFPFVLDTKQPARNKLDRRLQSAWIVALFYRMGFDVFNDRITDLAEVHTYLPSNALRRDASAGTTHVFAGVRYMGIAHGEKEMLLAHYIDDGYMYITSEMRIFNTVTAPYHSSPAVIYCGFSYEEIIKLLTGTHAFLPAKRRGSDAVTYRIGAERTQYPLYIAETTDTGAFQLAMITTVSDYRQRIAEYALQASYAPRPEDAPMLDAMMGNIPFMVCVDMDITRMRQAVDYAKGRGFTVIAIVALPRQLNALESWFEEMFSIELYVIEQLELEQLFSEMILRRDLTYPYETSEGCRYVVVE